MGISKSEQLRQFYLANINELETSSVIIGDRFNLDYGMVRRIRLQVRKRIGSISEVEKQTPTATHQRTEDKKSWDEKDTSASFEYSGVNHNINNLQDALEFSNVDLKVWEIERHVFNSWEVTLKNIKGEPEKATNIQVKIWFKKKVQEIAENKFKEELLTEIRNIKPIIYKPDYKFNKKQNGCLYEVDIFDIHFGKHAWGKESGEDYDLTIAKERYMNAIEDLLNKAQNYNIEKILLPIGNDLLHYDTIAVTTTAGTKQDSDTRWQKMFMESRISIMNAISILRQVAPVEILRVPSNHDFQSSFYLGDLLECYYEKDKFINVDNSPKTRKYFKYGKCGIGFTHGNEEKHTDLPLIMTRETQKLWSDVEFMEWHLGHFHKKKEVKYLSTDEYNGIVVRILRSLSSSDFWHFSKGYTENIKAAEGFVWDKESGMVANLIHICK